MTEKEEIILLKKYADLIWGGVPTDIEWALNTQVWKNFLINDIHTTTKHSRTR